jgi:hypothetical protein
LDQLQAVRAGAVAGVGVPAAATVFDLQAAPGVVHVGADGKELPAGLAVQDGVGGQFPV